VRGGLVEDQHGRVRKQGTGQRQTLPLATGHRYAADPGLGVPAAGQGLDPRQQAGPGSRVAELDPFARLMELSSSDINILLSDNAQIP
jgi:hypothetical protein